MTNNRLAINKQPKRKRRPTLPEAAQKNMLQEATTRAYPRSSAPQNEQLFQTLRHQRVRVTPNIHDQLAPYEEAESPITQLALPDHRRIDELEQTNGELLPTRSTRHRIKNSKMSWLLILTTILLTGFAAWAYLYKFNYDIIKNLLPIS